MLGLGLLVRLGRQVLAGPVADSGVLPAGYYRHLVLAALEEEDFPGALRHLKWVERPAPGPDHHAPPAAAERRAPAAVGGRPGPLALGVERRRAGSATRPC